MRLWLLRGLLALLCGVALWPAASAQAQAHLIEATPRDGAVLATPPPRLQLLFDEELDEEQSEVRVTGPGGQRADRQDKQVDGVRMWLSLLDQGPGTYRVQWKSVADDDKGVIRGSYGFTVQAQPRAGVSWLAISPATTTNGQPVTLSGSGFAADSTVLLSVGDDEAPLTGPRADSAGRFTAQVALPADLPQGRQVIQGVDPAGNLATAALHVASGGAGVMAIRIDTEADGEEDTIAYTLRVENHSGWQLRNIILRGLVPEGTRVLAADLGQPEGVDAPDVGGGQVVWRAHAVAPHAISGPYTFSVSTAGLPDRSTALTIASVEFAHTASAPTFRAVVRSAEVPVQIVR
ncbi:MAG TPA: copper resistance CopC family protein [Chloroflexota bacterium]